MVSVNINELNDTAAEYPSDKTIHQLFEERAAMFPDSIALVYSGGRAAYGELNILSNKIAWLLKDRGIGPGDSVGVIMDRGIEMVAALIAVLKAGAAYVPVDPEYPAQRKKYIIEHSKIRAVITLKMESVSCEIQINLKSENLDAMSANNPVAAGNPDSLAYVIYTSGSTGLPKGVMISHRAAVNLIHWVNRRFDVGEKDALLFVTSVCFDLSVYDIFGILAAGGRVVIARQEQVKDPLALATLIRDEKITFWDSVPTTMNSLVHTLKERRPDYTEGSLRLVFLSGDWIQMNLPAAITSVFPNANVISLGGATECTVWSIYYPIKNVDKNWKSIPYGKPIDNTGFYILDENQNPVPDGTAGQLYIGGAGVALGYFDDPQRTASAFFPDRFAKTGALMYRTGDLGRLMEDDIEFLGRIDDQVKIRGFRVEIGEIENRILQVEGIRETAVADRTDAAGNKYLCAYIVCGPHTDLGAVKNHLVKVLPAYMVPSVLVKLEKLPLNTNGKIDRRALPEPSIADMYSSAEFVPLATENERGLAAIWEKVLDIRGIGASHDFFEIGGSSVLAASLSAEYEKSGIPLDLLDITRFTNIRDQAKRLEQRKGGASSDPPLPGTAGHATETRVCDCPEAESLGSRIIKNVEPFNDVFYKNCFYHSLFPVITHFSKSILSFLANDVGVYTYDATRGALGLGADYLSEEPDNGLLNQMGISEYTEVPLNDLTERLIHAVDSGRPVIIFVDSFYEPFRIDTYQKMHYAHTLLIYGYDNQKRLFHIIEHAHHDALSYKKRVISFEDTDKAYEGYSAAFGESEYSRYSAYTEFYAVPEEEPLDLKRVMKKNAEKRKAEITSGIDSLIAFTGDYAELLAKGGEAVLTSAGGLIRALNGIMDNRRVERYKLEKIFGTGCPLNGLLTPIIGLWGEIRTDLIKLRTNPVYKPEAFKAHLIKLHEIYGTELRYARGYLDLFKN